MNGGRVQCKWCLDALYVGTQPCIACRPIAYVSELRSQGRRLPRVRQRTLLARMKGVKLDKRFR